MKCNHKPTFLYPQQEAFNKKKKKKKKKTYMKMLSSEASFIEKVKWHRLSLLAQIQI